MPNSTTPRAAAASRLPRAFHRLVLDAFTHAGLAANPYAAAALLAHRDPPPPPAPPERLRDLLRCRAEARRCAAQIDAYLHEAAG